MREDDLYLKTRSHEFQLKQYTFMLGKFSKRRDRKSLKTDSVQVCRSKQKKRKKERNERKKERKKIPHTETNGINDFKEVHSKHHPYCLVVIMQRDDWHLENFQNTRLYMVGSIRFQKWSLVSLEGSDWHLVDFWKIIV